MKLSDTFAFAPCLCSGWLCLSRFLDKAPVAEHEDKAIVDRLQSLEETVNTLRGILEEIK
ncbi:hypothetical protein LSAT2_031539, partial [Lamellibrachia satsuma]